MKTRNIFIFLLVLYSTSSIFAQSNKLTDYVQKLENDKHLASTTFSINVFNITKNESIYSYDKNRSLVPASIVKLITTAAGFEKLGKNFRFKTTIGYTGTIDENGLLQGNVYIIGGGDPLLGSYRYKETVIDSVFAIWKQALSDAGIKKISQRICYDASIYDNKQLHDSWMWGDIGNYYGCGVSGLNIHENMYFAHFTAGSSLNHPATIEKITPGNIDIRNQNEVTTGPANSGDNVVIYGEPNSNIRSYVGTVPFGKRDFKIRGSIPYPPKTCAEIFAKYLSNNGIETSPYVSEASFKTNHIKILFDYFSPSYQDIVRYTNQTSNNIYAESIYKYLGFVNYQEGSFESGALAINNFLKEHNLVPKGIKLVDGSGLSRQNMLTTDFVCNFLKEIASSPYFEDFKQTLPKIGESGTAKNMLKNSQKKVEIYIKSGNMTGIQSYAGYIVGNNGNLICFCFMVNNYDCSPAVVYKKFEDMLLIILEEV